MARTNFATCFLSCRRSCFVFDPPSSCRLRFQTRAKESSRAGVHNVGSRACCSDGVRARIVAGVRDLWGEPGMVARVWSTTSRRNVSATAHLPKPADISMIAVWNGPLQTARGSQLSRSFGRFGWSHFARRRQNLVHSDHRCRSKHARRGYFGGDCWAIRSHMIMFWHNLARDGPCLAGFGQTWPDSVQLLSILWPFEVEVGVRRPDVHPKMPLRVYLGYVIRFRPAPHSAWSKSASSFRAFLRDARRAAR